MVAAAAPLAGPALSERIGDLLVVGPVVKRNRVCSVKLKCLHLVKGKQCGRVFSRRVSRLKNTRPMCNECAAKERSRARCSNCQSTEHTRDKCTAAPAPRKRCQLCFNTPHMVHGPYCKGCGIAYVPEQMPSSRTPVVPREPLRPPLVVAPVDLGRIRIDGGTQSRVSIDERVVAEYTELVQAGAKLPPPVVYYDGGDYWLADGFHRVYAHRGIGTVKVACEVRAGGLRDAILFSVGANAVHGLRRTNADKHRAVEKLLLDREWSSNSDRWIADRCAVSVDMVNRARRALRPQLSVPDSSKSVPPPTTRQGLDGKVRRLPVRTPPVFNIERARARLEGTVDALVSGWPDDVKIALLAMWLRALADRVEADRAERQRRKATGR